MFHGLTHSENLGGHTLAYPLAYTLAWCPEVSAGKLHMERAPPIPDQSHPSRSGGSGPLMYADCLSCCAIERAHLSRSTALFIDGRTWTDAFVMDWCTDGAVCAALICRPYTAAALRSMFAATLCLFVTHRHVHLSAERRADHVAGARLAVIRIVVLRRFVSVIMFCFQQDFREGQQSESVDTNGLYTACHHRRHKVSAVAVLDRLGMELLPRRTTAGPCSSSTIR